MTEGRWFILFVFSHLLLSCTSNGQMEKDITEKDVMIDVNNNIIDGEYIGRHKNGNISIHGFVNDGLKNGVWKSFHIDGSLEKVYQYFNDTLLFVLDKNDFLFSRKFLKDKKIGIDIPIKWNTQQNAPPMLLTAKKQCSDSIAFCPNITILKDILLNNSEIDFENYIKSNITLLQERLPYFKPIAGGSVMINNLSAYQMTYLMQIDNVKLGGITTWICDDSDIYIITGMAINEINSEFLKYKDLFQEITNSFSRH